MTAPAPTYGTVGTYAAGTELSRLAFNSGDGRLVVLTPSRKARGTIVRVWANVPNVVEIRESGTDALTLIRLPHGGTR